MPESLFVGERHFDADDSRFVDELSDRVRWISQLLALRVASDDASRARATERLIEAHERVVSRPSEGTRHELLRERLGLSETELQVIWLLAAFAIDFATQQVMLNQTTVPPALTLEVLRRIVYGERPSRVALQELASDGRLRRLALIDRNDGHPSESPETRWTWTIAPRLLAWLHGDDRVDPALGSVAQMPSAAPSVDELAISAAALIDARKAILSPRSTIIASGSPGLGRRTLLTAVAGEAGLNVLYVDCTQLERAPEASKVQMRALARECRLLDRVPLLVNLDAVATDSPDDSRSEALGREFVALLDTTTVLVTCGMQRPATRWGRPTIVIELEQPTSEQRARVWHDALGEGTAEGTHGLARMYPLAPAMIHHAAAAARARAGVEPIQSADLAAGIRAVLDDRLGQLARRVDIRQTWDDLVLPDDQMEAIVDLVARVRESALVYERWGFGAKVGKALGVTALFSGPPGTGKTMVAALIARDLGLELYQVDLARVVSKWIGESERNLAKVFDAAEAGHAILLFDEADALFGKRTEVRSSNDRYANLETNYLLQRLESFTGVCLLTSNHESNIDPAFQRRLSLHLRFELPDVEERARLWRTMLSTTAPVAKDVDYDALARRYELSGGSIRNAALRAAFFAAGKQTAIEMRHIERAARLEYEGLGKIAL